MTTHSTDVFARFSPLKISASFMTHRLKPHRLISIPVFSLCPFGIPCPYHVYDMLVSHEVSHALHTPLEAGRKNWTPPGANASLVQHYINVVEDVRIERMIQAKFPGLRPDYKPAVNG